MARQMSTQRGGYLEALLVGCPVAILATNSEGTITFANNEACKLVERDMRELIGESITIVYENLAGAREANRQIYSHGGIIRDHETNCRTKSGKLVRVRVSAAHLKDSNGTYAGAVGFFETYRPWTEAENRSRALSAELQARLDQCKDMAVPVFELYPGLIMVLVSCPVEPARLERVTHELLHQMKTAKARVVLMDLSCVTTADTSVANQLCKSVRSINLSGGKCILSGIQPDFAQVLEPLIGDTSYLKFFTSADQALEAAFDMLGYELRPRQKT